MRVAALGSIAALAACEPPPDQPELLTYIPQPVCIFFCEVAIEQIDEKVTAEGGGSITNTTQGGAIAQEQTEDAGP